MSFKTQSTSKRRMWLFPFVLIALCSISLLAGCASDSGYRSSDGYNNSHAGHNH